MQFKLWCVKAGVSMQAVLETMIREQIKEPYGIVNGKSLIVGKIRNKKSN